MPITTKPILVLRNKQQIESRIEDDWSMCGKFFRPSNLLNVFGSPINDKDDKDFEPPEWLLKSINQVANSTVSPPAEPPFWFFANKESVQHKKDLLADYGFDLAQLINDHKDTALAYGPEFCLIEDLASIYCGHEFFPFLHQASSRRNGIYIQKNTRWQ